MAANRQHVQTVTERCPDCERETHHRVDIRILTESVREKNAEFSREPYRVATCRACGHSTSARMNNA